MRRCVCTKQEQINYKVYIYIYIYIWSQTRPCTVQLEVGFMCTKYDGNNQFLSRYVGFFTVMLAELTFKVLTSVALDTLGNDTLRMRD